MKFIFYNIFRNRDVFRNINKQIQQLESESFEKKKQRRRKKEKKQKSIYSYIYTWTFSSSVISLTCILGAIVPYSLESVPSS